MDYTISFGAWEFELYLNIEDEQGQPVLADIEITEANNKFCPSDELSNQEQELMIPRLVTKVLKEWHKVEEFLMIKQELFKKGII